MEPPGRSHAPESGHQLEASAQPGLRADNWQIRASLRVPETPQEGPWASAKISCPSPSRPQAPIPRWPLGCCAPSPLQRECKALALGREGRC